MDIFEYNALAPLVPGRTYRCILVHPQGLPVLPLAYAQAKPKQAGAAKRRALQILRGIRYLPAGTTFAVRAAEGEGGALKYRVDATTPLGTLERGWVKSLALQGCTLAAVA